MGAKLGRSALSLGRNARQQFSMVARTGAGYPTDFSYIPDRSRPGILPHLRFSMAPEEEQRIPAARSTPDVGTNRRPAAAFHSPRRLYSRKLRWEQTRGRRISPR